VSRVTMRVHLPVTQNSAWRGPHKKISVLLPECMFTDPLPSTGHDADNIENTSSNTFSTVAYAYFGRCSEMGLHITVYSKNDDIVS
jgi:hypothetical protein